MCTTCRYPVKVGKDYRLFQGIHYHKKQNKNQTIKMNAVDCKRLVKEFEEFIDALASDVVSKSSNQDAARQVVTAKLDVRCKYHFCSHNECQKLVASGIHIPTQKRPSYQILQASQGRIWIKSVDEK